MGKEGLCVAGGGGGGGHFFTILNIHSVVAFGFFVLLALP